MDAVRKCMGNPDADEVNEILKNEQIMQVGAEDRGDVTILPTLVINKSQYRGEWMFIIILFVSSVYISTASCKNQALLEPVYMLFS